MSKARKVLAIAVSALLLVTAMSFTAMAVPAPSATVTELTGSDLVVTLAADSKPASLVGQTFTMASGVQFTANDTDPGALGQYICDFEITVNSPTGSVDGSQFILVGNYGTYGDVGLQFNGPVANDTYAVLEQLGLDTCLTYAEVVNDVQSFKCGIVDLGMPKGTKVNVQLTMYENNNGTRGAATAVDAPVVYDTLPGVLVEELKGTDLDVILAGESQPAALVGNKYTMASGVRFTATDATPGEFAQAICDFEITVNSPTGSVDGSQFILVGNYGTYGDVGLQFNGPVANGTYAVLEQLGLDTCLTYAEVLNDVQSFKCGIVDLGMPEGTTVDVQLTMYENDNGLRGASIPVDDPVQYVSTTSVEIIDADAFVGNDGTGNLRFISAINYEQGDAVYCFGTWFVPTSLLGDESNYADVYYDGSIDSGKTYTADLLNIPASKLATRISGISYAFISNLGTITSNVFTVSVEDLKNATSK